MTSAAKFQSFEPIRHELFYGREKGRSDKKKKKKKREKIKKSKINLNKISYGRYAFFCLLFFLLRIFSFFWFCFFICCLFYVKRNDKRKHDIHYSTQILFFSKEYTRPLLEHFFFFFFLKAYIYI